VSADVTRVTALRRRVEVTAPSTDDCLAVLCVGCGLAYLVLLTVRLPALITALNSDADVSSAWLLASVVGSAHAGQLVTSTQGAWLPLAFGVLTRGLPGHKVIWELSPLGLSAVSAALVGATVARVGGRRAGLLATLLILIAAPDTLGLLARPWAHNTTLLGAAVLGAFLVWWHTTARAPWAVAGVTVICGLVVGVLVSCDTMLLFDGVAPLVLASLVRSRRTGDPRLPAAAGLLACAALLGDVAVNSAMHALGATTIGPPLGLSLALVPDRLGWIGGGLLRLGGGLAMVHESPARLVLTAAAGAATVVGIGATVRMGARACRRGGEAVSELRAAHVAFWSATLVCSVLAYVLTVRVPSDQYLFLAVVAVAATVPLCVATPRARRLLLAGAAVYLCASVVALGYGDKPLMVRPQMLAGPAQRIAALVARDHLGVGYAGYWDAAPLDWASGLRLALHPITDYPGGRLAPADLAHLTGWYRPQRGSSFLVLEPGDDLLADHLPAHLPRPSRIYHVGAATIAAYRFDIAADFRR
jgi:hypothetical protein